MSGYEITNVIADDNFKLFLEFKEIGNESFIEYRVFDAKENLTNKKPPLSDLTKDLALFKKAHVIPYTGTVSWNDDIDIAVEFLYENSVLIPG